MTNQTKVLRSDSHTPTLWDSAVAWLFCVPVNFASNVPGSHWRAYSRVAAFAVFVAAPIAWAAWSHLFRLLLGSRTDWMLDNLLGLFMAIAILLLDSQVAGSLGRQQLSKMDRVLLGIRATFAVCLGAATAIATLLWILDPQLARERANQEVAALERDRVRVRELHKVPELERATANAQRTLDKAVSELSAMPALVPALRERGDACAIELQQLEHESSRALPALAGRRERLQESRRVQAAPPDSAAVNSRATLSGALREVETEISEATRRIALKKNECRALQSRIDAEVKTHNNQAREAHIAARAAYETATKIQAVAQDAADAQLKQLRERSEIAWGDNLAGDLAALASLLSRYLWPWPVALGVGLLVILTESTVALGKLRLRHGALDQLVALDEEKFAQDAAIRMLTFRVHGEIERAVMDQQEPVIEIARARGVAEATLDHAEALRRRRDAAAVSPDLRDLANDVFGIARNKMRDVVHRALSAGGSIRG